MSEGKIKVKISVAGRMYPLTIERSEEESVRRAGKKLNEMIKQFEKNYEIEDKQDVLSMCALMLSSKLELKDYQHKQDKKREKEKFNYLIDLIKEK